MTRRWILSGTAATLILLLLSVGAIGVGASHAGAQQGELARASSAPAAITRCVDFEDLPPGSLYHVGDTFASQGASIEVKDFQWSNGIWTGAGQATIGGAGLAGGAGLEAGVNNVNLAFDLGGPVEGLSFRFGEYGGNLNIEINGSFQNFANFHDIDMTTIGGVDIVVFGGFGNDQGVVILHGTVNQFAVGGQELWIDDLCPGPLADLGDAPDSTNNIAGSSMTAYPAGGPAGVLGQYPTVYNPALGAPIGPIHWQPKADAWLGQQVTREFEADTPPDQDGLTNLDPQGDQPDRDRADDGLVRGPLPDCQPTQITVWVTIVGPQRERFINVWYDWNRDGDWDDTLNCQTGAPAPEWAVQNYGFALGPGVYPITLPAFLPFNPNPNEPIWARVTLAEHPFDPAANDPADGRGPKKGYRYGETEDYYLVQKPDAPVDIVKTATVTETEVGGVIGFDIVIENQGDLPVDGLSMEDPLPEELSIDPASLTASIGNATYDPDTNTVRWQGSVEARGRAGIHFLAKPRPLAPICGRFIQNVAVLVGPNGDVIAHTGPALVFIRCPDLGDAPDSTNHFTPTMTAYPSVLANYPTVYDPATGAVRGPAHWRPRADSWLGRKVSRERDADLIPDEDGRPNLRPKLDQANLDLYDDGLLRPSLKHCEWTRVDVVVTIVGPARERFVNAWFDWNRDGDWEDVLECQSQGQILPVPEWAVQDHIIGYGPGVYTETLPAFLPVTPDPQRPLWARVTLSEHKAPLNPATGLADGRGPDPGYRFGETEDYYIAQQTKPPVVIIKRATANEVEIGEAFGYGIVVSNEGDEPADGLLVEDPLPEGLELLPDSLAASSGQASYDPDARIVRWEGSLNPQASAVIQFKVTVLPVKVFCGKAFSNVAVLYPALGAIAAPSQPVHVKLACPDLGDAPDSSNHSGVGMTAYGAVPARFPTVYDPATGLPSGPSHRFPRKDSWLGKWVSMERDADLAPDEDVATNLRPPANVADRDRFDDGIVRWPVLDHCQPTPMAVLVHVQPGAPTVPRYLNVWFDWARDGDWDDFFECPTQGQVIPAPEWAVQNHMTSLGPGDHVVVLPAFLPFNPTPQRPLWMRVTLSEGVAHVNPANNLADGSGPNPAFRFGETEDYLIEGQPGGEPELSIEKKVDKAVASPGDILEYTIVVHNHGNAPANNLIVQDPIPAGTTYVAGSASSSLPTVSFVPNVVTWQGNLNAGQSVIITFKVQIDRDIDRCEGKISNQARLLQETAFVIPSNEVHTQLICPDLGDAPDSSNHANLGMTTYPAGVTARFPTVFDPATGLPPGPRHLLPKADAWLGPREAPPTGERDADLPPDQDIVTNIDPPNNAADRDRADNGVFLNQLALPFCQPMRLPYQVTIVGPVRERFVNVWFDWNRDGDWEDVLECADGTQVPEWAVQNDVLTMGPGVYNLNSSSFLPWHLDPQQPDEAMWMRITLSEVPVPALAVGPADGRGPASGYLYGETEDYYLGKDDTADPPDVWVRKELRRATPQNDPASAGGGPTQFYYHIQYGNSGGSPAAGVQIVDTLPVSTSYHSSYSVPNIEPPAVAPPTVTWNAGTLSPGDSGWIDLWVQGIPGLPAGTVFTNVVQISTTSPGDDLANNTSTVTATIPLLPPRITWPIPGTVCTGTLTVTGVSQVGTVVDLYVDGVLTATVGVDAGGNWSVPLSLADGSHSIYAVARVVSPPLSSAPSATIIVIVDSSLLWDPMSMTFSTTHMGNTWVQHIQTPDGRADPDGWGVRLRPLGPDTTYTVTVKICCEAPTSVTLTVSDTQYSLAATGGGMYQASFPAPIVLDVPLTLTVVCGDETGGGSGVVLIDPDGYIFDVDVGVDKSDPIQNLAGMTSICLEYNANKAAWDRWPAELYESQINPQISGTDGYFSYYTPAGTYQIVVSPTVAYQGYRSWALEVIDEPVHIDIPVTAVYTKANYLVTVDSSGFLPAALEVVQGSLVEWANVELDDGVWHSSTSDVDARSDTSGWDSGLLNRGESYGRRMNTLGTFTYYDVEDPSLTGTVSVCYLYDFDCDGQVTVIDIIAVAGQWNKVSGAGDGYDARQDVNGDGRIDILDIMQTVGQWHWSAP